MTVTDFVQDAPAAHRVSRLVGAVAESATLAIDAKAKALKAAGEPVISFGAGEPDFPTPASIVEAAVQACRDVATHRYTPTGGLPALRQAVAEKTLRDSGYAVDSSQVLITNGGKQAIFNAFATTLDPGDEVIVPAPYWTTYPEAIRLAGAVPVSVNTDETTGFKVTVEALEAVRAPRTKMLVFVSPSNPSGAVYTPHETAAIGGWALEHGVWVLTDEIYEHLVYGDSVVTSLPVAVPQIADRCIVVNGVAKSYAMTGWRVGWVIGPQDVIKAATNLQSHATSNVCNVAQRAALEAISGDQASVGEMRAAFDHRRRTIHALLNEIPGVTCNEPEGAFYAFPSFKGVLGREITGRVPSNTLDLAEVILDEAKVAIVPGEAFGTPGYARFSYALSDDDLAEGVRRIAELLAG
jgi:aspartate aminotransferase